MLKPVQKKGGIGENAISRFSLAVGKGLRKKSYPFLLAHEVIKNRLNFRSRRTTRPGARFSDKGKRNT